MAKFSRRNFLKVSGAAGAASGLALAGCQVGGGSSGPKKVVVIGGGFGGATAARYLKHFDPSIDVTLVEVNTTYATCPGSNWVLGGLRKMSDITMTYDGLKAAGVKVVHDWVTGVSTGSRKVSLKGGGSLPYDRLIVSPGVDFDPMEGYDENHNPHAWKAGPQTDALRKQLEAMPDGGTFVIVPPPNPFRCPPGPAERISMVAHYFKQHKPKSKIIAVDVKPKFSKQGLFVEGWKANYDGMINYMHQQTIEGIDFKNRVVKTEFDDIKADVLNYIPPQKAGWIAKEAGLVDDKGWCPVDHKTWESTQQANVHVIGDAAHQSPLPKSGYAANSEAKVCAAAVADLLNGREPGDPSWVNTCYSLVAPTYGISVAAVYNLEGGKVASVKGAGGLSGKDTSRQLEAVYAESWWSNITKEIWG
ncbi:MAG: FAD-dependent oxidoreductase [Chromatiales bacterium]|nr:FAD-dependent oxidoreductase [Chromatiales bacterium]